MGQQEVGDFLEANKGVYFTVGFISKSLNKGESSVKHSLKSLLKRDGYVCRAQTGHSMRSGSLVTYAYIELEIEE